MRRRGFTLAELLIALTISSIIMLAVVSAFGLGLRTWRRVEDRRPVDETNRRVLAVLRRDLAGVYLPPPPAGAQTTFQAAGPANLSFFTASPGYYYGRPPGLCARVSYEYKDGSLTRTEQTVAGERPIADSATETLAEGLTSFAFVYMHGPASPGKGDKPADDFRPPGRVQVTLEWPTTSVSGQFLVPVRDPLSPTSQGSGAEQ